MLISVDHQCLMSTVTTSNYQQSNAFSQESVMSMARLPVPASVANRMSTAVAPGIVVHGKASSFPTGSEINCVAPAFH